MGPTASGKTRLAMALCDALDAEIINVDSALIYRGLNIGAARPTQEELQKYPHKLIDIRDPVEVYSVAEFCRDAQREIRATLASGKIPLLVGGTMMYFKALQDGLSDMPSADQNVREQIAKEARFAGWEKLHQQLEEIDPDSAAIIHPRHSQRISRALEVYRVSGKTLTHFKSVKSRGVMADYNCLQLALAPLERQTLHRRIAVRFEGMLAEGFVEEVKALYLRDDLHAGLPAMRAVGYQQIWNYLEGNYSYDAMKDKALAATRQLAKRQLTWLRSWADIHWLCACEGEENASNSREILQEALNFYQNRSIY